MLQRMLRVPFRLFPVNLKTVGLPHTLYSCPGFIHRRPQSGLMGLTRVLDSPSQ